MAARRGAALSLVLAAGLVSAAPASAQTPTPRQDARIFFWGNSGVSHISGPTATERTNVGVTLGQIAREAGVTGCAEGDFTGNLIPSMLDPDAYPEPEVLNFGMTLQYPCNADGWAEADFNVGVLTDNNFGLAIAGWGNVQGAVGRVNEAKRAEPALTSWYLYSYQHDMDESQYTFDTWKMTQQQQFIDAFHDLQDDINQADPSIEMRLIPLATIMLDLFRSGGILGDIPGSVLWVDDAPHQSETTAAIMGAVVFVAVHRQPIPASYTPPSYVEQRVRSRWSQIATFIWDRMNRPDLAPRVFGTSGMMGNPDAGVPPDMGNPPPPDMGTPDMGTPPVDTGVAPDAGSPAPDAGVEVDAGTGGSSDAGAVGTPPIQPGDRDVDGGCVCAEPRSGAAAGLGLLALGLVGFALRRRRH